MIKCPVEIWGILYYNFIKHERGIFNAMIGILFWNTNINSKNRNNIERNRRIEDAIVQLTIEKQCDIIVLAEYNIDTIGLCNKLSLRNKDFEESIVIQESRVKFVLNKRFRNELIRDDEYFIIQNISTFDFEFLLAGVHLPSKLYASDGDIEFVGLDLVSKVLESEKTVDHEKVIVVGDFNANPFEDIMTDAKYMHAIYNGEIVKKIKKREVYYKERQMFYNPMWNFLGDTRDSNGTYYSEAGKSKKFYWNIFDQVVLSADIIENFSKDTLQIIAKCENFSLVKDNGKPDSLMYSDHLPICFSIMEEII